MPFAPAPRSRLRTGDRKRLEAVVRKRTSPQREVLRARIILLCADGVPHRQIMPRSHSKFAVPREAFAEALQGVALTASQDSRAVRLDLSPQCVRLSANASGLARSQAEVPADFQGGGDPVIHTAFNPAYLQDALKTLHGDILVVDLDQNGIGCDGRVFGKPAALYALEDPVAKWVIMPVSAGLEPSRSRRAGIGSHYPEELDDKE
jgi:hypothetical protein